MVVAESDASVDGDAPDGGEPTYAFKPNLVGSPWLLMLKPAGLAWDVGRRSGLVRYDRIRRVRLSFRPVTLQTHRFVAEIWSHDSPKIQFASASWRSLVEQERLDASTQLEGTTAAQVPSEMVTASGGGLDPHIPTAAAALQAARVAAARGVPVERIRALIQSHTEPPTLGFLGRERINVLELNLALDAELPTRPTAGPRSSNATSPQGLVR